MDSVDEHADAVTDVTDADAVTLLRQFLAINTSHPSPDYQVTPLTVDGIQFFFLQGSTRWLEQQAGRLGLECRVEEAVEGKPTVVITRWGIVD